jgi:hypothetical protein
MRRMQKLTKYLGSLIFVCALLLVCPNGASSKTAAERKVQFGHRFWCENIVGNAMCLSVLRPECKLEVARTVALPNEPDDQLFLIHGDRKKLVNGPDQMVGCVEISDSAEALEYLRFFSSVRTVHLFDEKNLEIYHAAHDDCYVVCLPTERWQALGFTEPQFKETASGIQVTRFVIKPIPNRQEVTVYRITQEVGAAGEVREISSEPVSIPQWDLLRLGFPSYW